MALSPEVVSFFLFVVVVYVLCFFWGSEIEVHPEGGKEGSCSSEGDV